MFVFVGVLSPVFPVYNAGIFLPVPLYSTAGVDEKINSTFFSSVTPKASVNENVPYTSPKVFL
jgi:hypothetical protein